MPRLILFTRYPTPGEAKTRLIPTLGANGAAELHRVLTERTVALLRTVGAPVEVHVTGAPVEAFRDWLGQEVAFIPQAEGGLGERLLAALDPAQGRHAELVSASMPHRQPVMPNEAWTLKRVQHDDLTDRAVSPCIFFGADTPDLSPEIVAAAVAALETHDGVIGPADDGGYYLIGMREPQPALFTDMAWSTETVFPETMRRVAELGLNFLTLETLSDCDRPEDLARWPWLAT